MFIQPYGLLYIHFVYKAIRFTELHVFIQPYGLLYIHVFIRPYGLLYIHVFIQLYGLLYIHVFTFQIDELFSGSAVKRYYKGSKITKMR